MKVRKGGGEEIPLVQGKELQLRFAGAAVKRYPTPTPTPSCPCPCPFPTAAAKSLQSYPTLCDPREP